MCSRALHESHGWYNALPLLQYLLLQRHFVDQDICRGSIACCTPPVSALDMCSRALHPAHGWSNALLLLQYLLLQRHFVDHHICRGSIASRTPEARQEETAQRRSHMLQNLRHPTSTGKRRSNQSTRNRNHKKLHSPSASSHSDHYDRRCHHWLQASHWSGNLLLASCMPGHKRSSGSSHASSRCNSILLPGTGLHSRLHPHDVLHESSMCPAPEEVRCPSRSNA